MTKNVHSDLGPYPQRSTLAVAISTILAGANSAYAQQQETPTQRDYSGAAQTVTEEVVVTARKIEESMQDIAGSIQALGEADLKRIGAQDLEAYSRFIPSMTYTSISPGASKITFRGSDHS